MPLEETMVSNLAKCSRRNYWRQWHPAFQCHGLESCTMWNVCIRSYTYRIIHPFIVWWVVALVDPLYNQDTTNWYCLPAWSFEFVGVITVSNMPLQPCDEIGYSSRIGHDILLLSHMFVARFSYGRAYLLLGFSLSPFATLCQLEHHSTLLK